MRKILGGLIGMAALFHATGQAAPVLEKITKPGFVMPAYAITKTCTITNTGRMTQTFQIGKADSKQVVSVTLGKGVIEVIAEAAKGKIKESAGPVDTNTVFYNAYLNEGGRLKKVVLLENNGGNGVIKENDAEAALLLRNFIDLNCGDPVQ